MRFAFLISKEHETLPKAEVIACLDALKVRFTEIMHERGLLVFDLHNADFSIAHILAGRLGMTHHILLILGECAHEGDVKKTVAALSEVVDEADIERLLTSLFTTAFSARNASFAVRAMRFGMSRSDKCSSADAEREMGAFLKKKCRWLRVDLKKPAVTFVILLTETRVFLCVLAASVDKKQFQRRRPHMRPFCRPVTMSPKLARVVVNLSRVREGEVLIDPFCGTGGILMEASSIGVRAVGMDIMDEMARGSRQNLRSYGLNADLIVGDALKMPFRDESADAIVADMPYGRSSFVSLPSFVSLQHEAAKTKKTAASLLWSSAMEEISRVLKPRRTAVIISNAPLTAAEGDVPQLHVLEEHKYRVHKSLCRHITVLMKAIRINHQHNIHKQ